MRACGTPTAPGPASPWCGRGTLDASDGIVPRAHIWVKRKQPWIVLGVDVPAFEESAPPAEVCRNPDALAYSASTASTLPFGIFRKNTSGSTANEIQAIR